MPTTYDKPQQHMPSHHIILELSLNVHVYRLQSIYLKKNQQLTVNTSNAQ